MGAVVRIEAARDAQIIRALKHFLAQAEQGGLQGFSLQARDSDGVEDIVVVGVYRTTPALAVNAAMRMVSKLTQMQDRACDDRR